MLTHFERLMFCDELCAVILPNLPEFQMVVLALTASTSVRKQLAKQKKLLHYLHLHFVTFLLIY